MLDDADEECDDGNAVDGDSCDNDCTYTTLEIFGGGQHTCALIETGRVRCWGNGFAGSLGYGNTNTIGDDEDPSSAGDVSLPGGVLSLDLGGLFSCGLFEDDQMRCWGAAVNGQTGYAATASIGDNELLDMLVPVMLGGTATQFELGGSHVCVRLDASDARCWGANGQGQLGIGDNAMDNANIGDGEHPSEAAVVNLGPNDVAFVATGFSHSCAVTSNNELFCWGENSRGQLGYGSTGDIGNDEDPISANAVNVASMGLPVDATITELALGKEHTCALFSSGDVLCWGRANSGQIGQGDNVDYGDSMGELPSGLMPIDLGGVATSITAGDDFTCARINDGSIRCWGANGAGQLGQGNTEALGDDELPSTGVAVDVGGPALQVSAGSLHACAVREDYEVICWGEGGQAQLGYGNTDDIGNDEFPIAAGFVSVL
jgi:alpha-tubulin suppressor-like RCC1 family protein